MRPILLMSSLLVMATLTTPGALAEPRVLAAEGLDRVTAGAQAVRPAAFRALPPGIKRLLLKARPDVRHVKSRKTVRRVAGGKATVVKAQAAARCSGSCMAVARTSVVTIQR